MFIYKMNLVKKEVEGEDHFTPNKDKLYDFYKYLLDHDVSVSEYAEDLRELFKEICRIKGIPFVDLDQEVDEVTDNVTDNIPKSISGPPNLEDHSKVEEEGEDEDEGDPDMEGQDYNDID
nr:MAG TPA: Transcription factor e(y)2 [Cressdnaviricota sp.]